MNQIDSNASFEIETLQDWHLEAGANQDVPVETGASNSNTSNNSATEP